MCCSGGSRAVGAIYQPTYEPTKNLRSYMQRDLVTWDLGYVTNGGYSTRRHGGGKDNDNILVLEVEVMIGDEKPQTHATTLSLPFLVSTLSGDFIETKRTYINSERVDNFQNDKTKRPNIVMKLTSNDADRVYLKGEHVWAIGTLFHLNTSRGETRYISSDLEDPGQFTVRLIMPPWMAYIDGSDICYSNHTHRTWLIPTWPLPCPNSAQDPYKSLCYNVPCKVRNTDSGASNTVDLHFHGRIMFPDIIGIYMSFTVDPNDQLKLGSGIVQSMVVSVAYCTRKTQPAADLRTFLSQCGQYEGMSFKSSAPACSGIIAVDTCGAMASTALDENKLPKNVLSNDETFWSPHIRVGSKWKDYLMFDFRANARIISLNIVIRKEGMKLPLRFSVSTSNTAVSWKTVVSSVLLPADGALPVIPAVDARFARIMFDEYEVDNTSTLSCGIQHVTWNGCLVPKAQDKLPCHPDITGVADSVVTYRHVAWDAFNELFYFCDVAPATAGLVCKANVAGSSTWLELPRSIRNIVGYSPTKGKMYFRDLNGEPCMNSITGALQETSPPAPTVRT